MTDKITSYILIDGADPKLQTVADEIRKLLDKNEIAGCFQLASSTHTEFGMEVPKWSAIQFVKDETGNRCLHIKSNSKNDGSAHLESSVHLMLSMRDAMAEQSLYLNKIGEIIEKSLVDTGIELEHKTITDRKIEEYNDSSIKH